MKSTAAIGKMSRHDHARTGDPARLCIQMLTGLTDFLKKKVDRLNRKKMTGLFEKSRQVYSKEDDRFIRKK